MNRCQPYRVMRFARQRSAGLLSFFRLLCAVLLGLGVLGSGIAQGGGSGLNVVVVANQDSSNSVELANYYLGKRRVPPEQLLRISWTGGNVQWTKSQFETHLLNPLLAWLSDTGRANQVQYVLLSMDIPYRISGSVSNSTTAALFYGAKQGMETVNSSYAFSEARFDLEPPVPSPSNAFLAMMLTANSLEEARCIVDHGVAGDGACPTQTVWLAKSEDVARNQRYRRFDNAIFNTRFCDGYSLERTNQRSPGGWTNLLGYQAGVASLSLATNAFVAGAMADSMTSFGGKLFENPGQTTLLEFIEAGAAGSYGTVAEPNANVAKFPDPLVYFYQGRGFSLAECYYQSVYQPVQGLLVGEPLAAPWRKSLRCGWVGIESNAVLAGTTNLGVSVLSGGRDVLAQRLDLYVDGKFQQTLTNLVPRARNRLSVRFNGYPVTFEVPTNATLKGIAAGLVAELNKSIHTNITRVTARAYGDRIQLQSFAAPLPEGVFEVVDNGATITSPRVYLAAASPVSSTVSVAAGGWTEQGAFRVLFNSRPGQSNVVEASTNLLDWLVVATNAMGGAMEYVDADAWLYPNRFYRAARSPSSADVELRALAITTSNEFVVHISSPTNRPYILQSSSDFRNWSDVFTNTLGGESHFVDASYSDRTNRFFRTRSGDTNDYAPVVVVGQTPTGGNILHVQATVPGEIVVWASTNATDWVPIHTYPGQGLVQTETASLSSAGEPLTTQLVAARRDFLLSTAQGIREFGVELDFLGPPSLSNTSFLTLELTKTNASQVTLTVTNPAGNLSMSNFVKALVAAINTHPELMQEDGVEADDVMEGFPGQIVFNLRARMTGQRAAEVQARLWGSLDLFISPSSVVRLNQNLADLLPRNHLYVRAGVPSLYHSFDLDTTTLADGVHELTAVAFEGSHVHTQTLKPVSIVVSNTPLHAELALVTPSSVLPVTNNFDLLVTASLPDIERILLFSTGGFYDGKTNQSSAGFQVAGPDLGVGEHSFYALVTATNGWRYRTAPVSITLSRP